MERVDRGLYDQHMWEEIILDPVDNTPGTSKMVEACHQSTLWRVLLLGGYLRKTIDHVSEDTNVSWSTFMSMLQPTQL
ncbi:hypothetical protein TNCV_42481 [Trichonephila clavipes]|nr:hypothetical protein TNCV_42481 [Trichonephila clavipes]